MRVGLSPPADPKRPLLDLLLFWSFYSKALGWTRSGNPRAWEFFMFLSLEIEIILIIFYLAIWLRYKEKYIYDIRKNIDTRYKEIYIWYKKIYIRYGEIYIWYKKNISVSKIFLGISEEELPQLCPCALKKLCLALSWWARNFNLIT